MRRPSDNHTFHIYVNREAINHGVIEGRKLSGGWIRTSSHLYFQEALDEKDRINAKGLRVLLVDTSLSGFPRRTLYFTDSGRTDIRIEHPMRREIL